MRKPKNVSEAEKNGVSSLALARRLWRDYLGRYRGKLLIALFAMGAYAVSASAIPAGVEAINATFLGEGRFASGGRFALPAESVALWGPALIVLLGAANAGAQYLQSRLSASAALSALRDIQNDAFARLTRIDDAQLRGVGAGQATARLTNDAMVLRDTLTRASNAVRDLLTMIGLLGVMLWYDWALFLVVFVVYPALGWPVGRIGRHIRRRSREAQGQAGEIASLAVEAVTGGRLIRAYGLEAAMQEKARGAFDARLRVLTRMAHLRAMNEPFIFFVGAVALAIIVGVVALRIEAGALNITELISFIIALLLLSQPARGLSTLNAVAQEGFGAFERLAGLIDLEPQIVDRKDAAALDVKEGAVRFRNVSFAYDGNAAALDDFSLEVPGGTSLALVGESGAGKSTAFNLLLRLYEPDAGAVEIDGQDVAAVRVASLRANIAVVSQETMLFDDTVRANIAHGRLEADDAAIEVAAKAAAAHDFITALPDGYDTRVGEGGGRLSGGQRQRIAIARAFLKDAPVLLLDEATSALDAETERQVQEALARLSAGRTTIIIAHRLATVLNADRIVVMDRGRVVETGDHESLSQQDGAYRKLAALQFGAR